VKDVKLESRNELHAEGVAIATFCEREEKANREPTVLYLQAVNLPTMSEGERSSPILHHLQAATHLGMRGRGSKSGSTALHRAVKVHVA
jgi:hypothetical protein